MKWTGTVVAIIEHVDKLPGHVVYLIKTDDGDRIWRFEDELDWAPGVPRRDEIATEREGAPVH